jgi:hypothetical protein
MGNTNSNGVLPVLGPVSSSSLTGSTLTMKVRYTSWIAETRAYKFSLTTGASCANGKVLLLVDPHAVTTDDTGALFVVDGGGMRYSVRACRASCVSPRRVTFAILGKSVLDTTSPSVLTERSTLPMSGLKVS